MYTSSDDESRVPSTDPKRTHLPPAPPVLVTTGGDDEEHRCARCGTKLEEDEQVCPQCNYINSAND